MYIKYLILTLVTLLFACSPDSETTETPASSSDRAIHLATNPPPPSTPPPEVDKVVLQLGHSHWVKSVAFSPDGKTALSGSWDNTVKWWDLSSCRVIKSLEAHSSSVDSVAFSPDGKTALSGSWDTTTRLWNLKTGKEIIRLVGFDDGEGVAIMPQQGYYVASPKGEKYINVDFGNNRVEGIEGYEKYKKFYHRPDILKLAWQLSDAERAIALANQKTQVATVSPLIPPQKRFALVIGNSKYQYYSTLDNAENDANKLAQVLRTLGFEVTLATNLKLRQMKKVFRACLRSF